MAENTASITYKQVERAVGKFGGSALEVWGKIGRITGAGIPPRDADGDATIALTGVSDSKRAQIDALLEKAEERDDEGKAEATAAKSKGKEK